MECGARRQDETRRQLVVWPTAAARLFCMLSCRLRRLHRWSRRRCARLVARTARPGGAHAAAGAGRRRRGSGICWLVVARQGRRHRSRDRCLGRVRRRTPYGRWCASGFLGRCRSRGGRLHSLWCRSELLRVGGRRGGGRRLLGRWLVLASVAGLLRCISRLLARRARLLLVVWHRAQSVPEGPATSTSQVFATPTRTHATTTVSSAASAG